MREKKKKRPEHDHLAGQVNVGNEAGQQGKTSLQFMACPRVAGKGEAVGRAIMIKADICDLVYDRIGFSKVEAVDVVETVFDVLKEALGSGERVQIVGFGTFSVREKKERLGRNPKTGAEMWISPRRALIFKPSKILRDFLNSSDGFSSHDGFSGR